MKILIIGIHQKRNGKDFQRQLNDILFSPNPWKDEKLGVEKTIINSTIVIKHFICPKLAKKLCENNNSKVIYPHGTVIIEDQIDEVRKYLAEIGDNKLLSKSDDSLKKAILRELKKVNSGE